MTQAHTQAAGIESVAAIRRAPSLSQAISGRLQELIAQKRFEQGDRLPGERDLAAALAVGRPALREAIRYLEGLGIVSVIHGKGVFVAQRQSPPITDLSTLPSADRLALLRQATDVRRLLDVEATRQAATRATTADLRRIENCLDESESEPMLTRSKFAIDMSFEQSIGEATHNAYLAAVQRVAHQMFKAAWESCGLIPRPAEMRSEHHRAIFVAIKARDVDAGERLMNRHFAISVLPPIAVGNRRRPAKSSR